jgi:hypothetical protein
MVTKVVWIDPHQHPSSGCAGGQWSSSARSHLTYFTDDLDMPVVDKYGTQEPIALLRCFTDYELWCEPGGSRVARQSLPLSGSVIPTLEVFCG